MVRVAGRKPMHSLRRTGLAVLAVCALWLPVSDAAEPVPVGALAPAELAALQQHVELAIANFLAALKLPGAPAQALQRQAEQTVNDWLAAASMARRLAGTENWQTLQAEQKQALSNEMARTASRYLLETSALYSGQTVAVVALTPLSASRMQLALSVRGVPGRDNVPVLLELQRVAEQWRIADFSVEGISYATTKRWQFQVLWQSGGYSSYQQHLKEKNDVFFKQWARQSSMNSTAAESHAGLPD